MELEVLVLLATQDILQASPRCNRIEGISATLLPIPLDVFKVLLWLLLKHFRPNGALLSQELPTRVPFNGWMLLAVLRITRYMESHLQV